MVRPVDLQHIISKSSAAEKWQQVVQQQQEINRLESTLKSLKEADINKERVKYLESKENAKIREEGKESKNGEYYENNDRNKEEKQAKKAEKGHTPSPNNKNKSHSINIIV